MAAMMRSGSAGPNSSVTGVANGGHILLNQLQARMGQILDDADHRRCSEGNQRALLAEKLENLRQLTKELEKDEWMYAPRNKSRNNGLTLSKIPNNKKLPPF